MSLFARLRGRLRRGGGTIPKPPPVAPCEERVILSPGWVKLPPGTGHCYPPDFINRLNQPRKPSA